MYVLKHRACLLKEFSKPLVIEEVQTPTLKPYEVLIKVLAAGVCHSDLHLWLGDFVPQGLPKKLPIVLSHEVVGEVVDVGEGVPSNFRRGVKVLVYPWQYVEEDQLTIKGFTQLARKRLRLGIDVDGGLQEYLISNYKFLVSIEGIEDIPALAPLGCAALTTYRAVKKARTFVEPDDYVVLIGLGGLGSYAAQWIKLLIPYSRLVGVDVRDEAIEFVSKITNVDVVVNASKEDPTKVLNELTSGLGVKAVIDLVGSPETVSKYINVVDTLGVYVLVGHMGRVEVPIPRPRIIRNEITITGSYTGSLADQYEVISLVRRGLLKYREVVTKRYRFEEVNEAFNTLKEGKVVGRQVVLIT